MRQSRRSSIIAGSVDKGGQWIKRPPIPNIVSYPSNMELDGTGRVLALRGGGGAVLKVIDWDARTQSWSTRPTPPSQASPAYTNNLQVSDNGLRIVYQYQLASPYWYCYSSDTVNWYPKTTPTFSSDINILSTNSEMDVAILINSTGSSYKSFRFRVDQTAWDEITPPTFSNPQNILEIAWSRLSQSVRGCALLVRTSIYSYIHQYNGNSFMQRTTIDITGVTFTGVVCVNGGDTIAATTSNATYIYDFTGSSWTVRPPLPHSVVLAMSEDGKRIFLYDDTYVITYDWNGTSWYESLPYIDVGSPYLRKIDCITNGLSIALQIEASPYVTVYDWVE